MRFRFIPLLLVALTANAQRLPSNVHPEHYTLHFTPDLKTATFTGEETIDLTLDAATSDITLNAIELKIADVQSGTQSATVSYHEEKQQATFHFPSVLPAGKASLKITFTGILNDKLRGFYLSKTAKRSYAVTQFESTDARRAFPSFDEPALKATFDIALTIDKGDTVISNGPQIKDEAAGPGKHTLTFATTPKMSTYLVAFQVGDFKCTSSKSEGVPIRACATPDKVEMTHYAVKAAKHFLHYYNTYFGIKYPMQKLDMIGIPDFEAGAMENFGCITYRETDLLIDEKHASVPALRRVAVVVAHEMAHQWFGDMVTMQWWDNIWLNEGFANWMESKAVGEWKPKLNMRDDEAQTLTATLDLDSQVNTHAIRATADTPAQIEEMFDGISYGKGGSVIGMVEHYLGEEIFRKGVHRYLAAHLYANATAEDFWNAQTTESGKPVDTIMSSFVEQIGAPLLTLGQSIDGQATIAQSRFFLNPGSTIDGTQAWTVPVCFTGLPCQVVKPGDATVATPAAGQPLYASAAYKGYYRVAYSPADLPSILAAAPRLTSPERIGLVGNQWALTRAGQLTVASYLDLVLALRNEDDAAVLDTAFNGVNYLQGRIATADQRKQMAAILRPAFSPIYRSLPKLRIHETPNESERRSSLFGLLGRAGDPTVLEEARGLADRYFRHDDSVDVLLATDAIQIVAFTGDAAFYDRVLAWERAAQDPRNRAAALATLADFTDPALVDRTLQLAISGEIKKQDSFSLITRLIGRPDTRRQAWAYLKQNWSKASATFTVSSGQRIVGSTGSFCSAEDHSDVAAFFAAHPVASSERTLRLALAAIDTCTAMRQSQASALDAWLTHNSAH